MSGTRLRGAALLVAAGWLAACGGSPPPSPAPAAPAHEIVIRSLTPGKDVYVFRIEDAAARRIEFANGKIEGDGRVYLHPDQKVYALFIHGVGSYRQALPTDGPVTLVFYKLTSGGRARVEWNGATREIETVSPVVAGEWEQVALAPAR